MAPAGGQPAQDRQRLVCVTRFASHQAGVWRLRGRGAPGRGGPGLAARAVQEQPREAAADTRAPGELPTSAQSRGPAAAASASFQPRKSGEQSRAGLIQKDAVKKFDFPGPLHETSKITKKRKKVWGKVYKVIARMIAENERYRLRLRCQKLSNKNSK